MILLGAMSPDGSTRTKFLSSSDQVLLTRGRDVAALPLFASHACTPISLVCLLFIPSRLRCLCNTDTDLLLTLFLTSPYSSALFDPRCPMSLGR